MKKILLYGSLAMLMIVSLALVTAASQDLVFLILSLLVAASIMMIAACLMDANARKWFGIYVLVSASLLFYISGPTGMGQIVLMGLAAAIFLSLFWVYWLWKKDTDPKTIVYIALFGKAALLPPEILNLLLSNASGDGTFNTLSAVFVVITSAYALLGLYKMIKADMIAKPAGILLGIMQFMIFSDVLSTAALAWMAWRWKPPVIPEKTPLYKKAVFSNSRRKNKA